jgi:predicted transcriptional regulator
MRTTITIQDDLYRRVKSEAAATGRSVGELIEDALRDALAAPARR